MGLVPGQWINRRYRLRSLLGGGGMGKVWLARDETLDRDVAVKEVSLPLAIPPERRRELHGRALREARAAGGLKHPGIVTVHDVLYLRGEPLIVMEVVRGPSLEEVIARDGPLAPAEAVRIGKAVLDVLRTAHAKGIIHRDVKPSNILLEGDRVVLTDFGIALLNDDSFSTQEDSVIGTPSFMAPEQTRRSKVTAAADLWSLGATLFAAVEGRPPITGHSRLAVLGELISDRPVPRARSAGPLTPIIDALLQKDPARRPSVRQTARLLDWAGGQLDGAAKDTLELPPRNGPRRVSRRRSLAAVLGVALVAVAAFLLYPALEKGRSPVHYESLITLIIKGKYQPFAFGTGKDKPSLFAVGDGNAVLLYEIGSFPEAQRLTGHENTIRGLAFNGDGSRLASFSDDTSIIVWNVDDPGSGTLLSGHQGEVVQAVFGPDPLLLARDTAERPSFKLWDFSTGYQIASLGTVEPVVDLAFTAQARHPLGLVETDADEVQVWNLSARSSPLTLKGHDDLINVSEISSDGRTVVTASDDQSLRIWELPEDWKPTELEPTRVVPDLEGVDRITFSPDGKLFATAGSLAKSARVWQVDGEQATAPLNHGSQVTALAFAPDGKTLATGGDDHAVRLWRLGEGGTDGNEAAIVLDEHEAAIKQIEISSDGRFLAAVDLNGVAKIWQIGD